MKGWRVRSSAPSKWLLVAAVSLALVLGAAATGVAILQRDTASRMSRDNEHGPLTAQRVPGMGSGVRRWTHWETSWSTLDEGFDRRIFARIELSDFLQFAAANALSCRSAKPNRHTCYREFVDCRSSARGFQGLPDEFFNRLSLRRDPTMHGCWEFSAAQWTKGQMLAIDYMYHPYY